ncbi:hypothetical protein KIW84_014053 [Lathyrus oleraceus]|uniref:Transposase MuDR plant domain-containing protein n=1 Tax=Pisum sativum TaxID=3888 RepID=A0A9D5BM59_PEA|nr:hypothetical protein KIW84_014053 [Pisum sativum]
MKGVYFDDSEEERMKGFDASGDEKVDDGLNEGVDGEPRDGENPSKPTNNIFITQEMGKVHVIEEEHMTEEPDSWEDDDSCDDRPSVIRFKEDDSLSKHCTLKVGMEFSSLEQFKKAILEHNVLNGREVSRVLTTTTFRIKTLFHKDKCGRWFFNKSAKAKWVTKVIVNGLKNNTKMKLNEVVTNVRLRYVTKVPYCRAFKARKLAREIVEEDSSKQYNLLWSYSSELVGTSPGNTFKININSPVPNL